MAEKETSNIQCSASKSIRPFRSSEEYLDAMKEDLAEWLNALYGLAVPGGGGGFLEALETGAVLCRHANNVNGIARDFAGARPEAAARLRLPAREVVFQAHGVAPGSFLARDNVSNFIAWCRGELGIPDVLMFETDDLVLRKNEKNFVLCLLEVARRGSKFGVLAPMLIQLEEEIEEELRDQAQQPGPPTAAGDPDKDRQPDPASGMGACPGRGPRMTLCDLRNLDELVREILGRCTCPDQFPMIKVSEGKYRVGDSSALIFVRVLRSHVMVRVGGGWDTLEHYLDKHDPCRCASVSHRLPQPRALAFSPQKVSPVPSPRASSPGAQRWPDAGGSGPGGERRGSRTEGLPARLGAGGTGSPQASAGPRAHRDGPDTRQSSAHRPPRSRRCSGDSDSSASSAQSGVLGCCRAEEGSPGPRKDGSSQRGARVPAALRRPPAPRSESRDRGPGPSPRGEERGRPRGAHGARDARPTAPSPARRARSQGREDQPLLIRRDPDGQHSMARAGGSGRSTPRAGSPAPPRPRPQPPSAPEPPRPVRAVDTLSQELEELARTFRAPLQLDPKQEQQLYRRLEEEFLANSKALEAERAALAQAPPSAPEPAAPDSAYCSSSSSSSSLSFFSKPGAPGGGPAPNGVPAVPNGSGETWDARAAARRRAPALSSSSDESNYCLGALDDVREVPEAGWRAAQGGGSGDDEGGPGRPSPAADPPRPRARPRADNQPARKPSRIPTPRAPQRPCQPHAALAGFPEPLARVPRAESGREGGAWM